MNKARLLPQMAWLGIKKNASVYVPYIAAGIFSVFVYYSFSSMSHNEIVETVPHSRYLMLFLELGFQLLGIILLPFLVYTNSFLMKSRKKEIGLYSILGMEKKHIAGMLGIETMLVYLLTVGGGILSGIVFSKLIFLIMMKMSGLDVNIAYQFELKSVLSVLKFFAAAYLLNLFLNIREVIKSNPSELLQSAKKGEKEPKHLWLFSIIGIAALMLGYWIAVHTKLNSYIFMDFFGSVLLVVIGTYFLFVAGSIVFLRAARKQKRFYYRPENFIMISGMLYRMKKNAASLVNICIFSTMTIITLMCTASLKFGTASILEFQYPFDLILDFEETSFQKKGELADKIENLEKKHQIQRKEQIVFSSWKLYADKLEEKYIPAEGSYFGKTVFQLLSLEDYNRMSGLEKELGDHEVLVYATGADYSEGTIQLGDMVYKVKEELADLPFEKKAADDTIRQKEYFIILKEEEEIRELAGDFSLEPGKGTYSVGLQLAGETENLENFSNDLDNWCREQEGFKNFQNSFERRKDTVAMNGGLLFIGVFFGLVFIMFLLLIMYYKQISEGLEDQNNFAVMQKVGMDDQEVKRVIKKQILIVFFFPLLVAVCHTMVAFPMIQVLMGTLYLYDRAMIAVCGIVVICIFAILYLVCYLFTSRSYYKIVKK